MNRKVLLYVFLACWVGITALIAVNNWNMPLTIWLAATFAIVGMISGLMWLGEVE